MIRKIIQIDENKCNGCGLCAKACHEGAIGMVAGSVNAMRAKTTRMMVAYSKAVDSCSVEKRSRKRSWSL